eukprot:1672593-Prymnesium_polylepis.1
MGINQSKAGALLWNRESINLQQPSTDQAFADTSESTATRSEEGGLQTNAGVRTRAGGSLPWGHKLFPTEGGVRRLGPPAHVPGDRPVA